jgi:hypothetical protein
LVDSFSEAVGEEWASEALEREEDDEEEEASTFTFSPLHCVFAFVFSVDKWKLSDS